MKKAVMPRLVLILSASMILFEATASTFSTTTLLKADDGIAASPSPVYPLKVSANGRYLVDQKNVPFLIAGDSPQALMANLSESQADAYFANRKAHGFNAAGWINVASATPTYVASHKDGSTYDNIRPFTGFLPGGNDYAHYDLSKPNEAYFARLDRMLELAAKHDIVVFLNPMETIDWLKTLRNNGPAAAHAYGQYLGKRYKNASNLVWLNGNDFNTWKTPADDAVVLAVAKGIKSVDPGHLQTIELNVPHSSSLDDPAWIPIISLNSTYTYAPTYIQMLHSYNQKPIAPTYLVEGHYDLEDVGDPKDFGTPSVLRRQAFWTMLSGGTGQFYGNRFTWTFEPGWQSKLDTPATKEFTIWKKFFASMPWHELVPDQAHKVVTAGLGTFGDLHTRVSKCDFCTAARSTDGALVIAYMPTVRSITVNMAGLKSAAKGRWFDPTNGAYVPIAGSPFANKGERQFTPPEKNHADDNDWVLVLQTKVQ
jgi:hypothetical protein